jgi:hypothetical protein
MFSARLRLAPKFDMSTRSRSFMTAVGSALHAGGHRWHDQPRGFTVEYWRMLGLSCLGSPGHWPLRRTFFLLCSTTSSAWLMVVAPPFSAPSWTAQSWTSIHACSWRWPYWPLISPLSCTNNYNSRVGLFYIHEDLSGPPCPFRTSLFLSILPFYCLSSHESVSPF